MPKTEEQTEDIANKDIPETDTEDKPQYITKKDLEIANAKLLDEVIKRLNLNNVKEEPKQEPQKEEVKQEKVKENYDF